ncbi:hypothetical protein Q604_UNBC05724G0001, partial [human gut metagenome]
MLVIGDFEDDVFTKRSLNNSLCRI